MRHAETLTHELAERFSAIELETAARWVRSRCTHVAVSSEKIVTTFKALDEVLARSRGVVAIRGLLRGSGLEVLYLPPTRAQVGSVVGVPGEIEPEVLTDIGSAFRSEFLASGCDMVRIEADDGAELIVHAVEVRAVVLAAVGVQLVDHLA